MLRSDVRKPVELFNYLIGFTLIFCLFEIGNFVQFSQFSLQEFSSTADHLNLPLGVLPPFLFFVLMQIVLHVLFVCLIWGQSLLIGDALNLSWSQTEKFSFYLWGMMIVSVLLANQYYYPNSHFSFLLNGVFTPNITMNFLIFLMCILAGIAVLSCYAIFRQVSLFKKIAFAIIMIVFFSYHIIQSRGVFVVDAATPSKPNIIIIGIDSLRPDFLNTVNKAGHNTPYLDSFLTQSTVFSDSFTPLARTFPSWMTILTGRYPIQTGARTDLENVQHLDVSQTLPVILRPTGYYSIFATDETRFSNIDKKMGFDRIISPPIGFNDFLIGAVNDFPLSNLVVNSVIGKVLFPYSYANRPVTATYDPDSFIHMLRPALLKSRSQPLLLAVHFCLPHSPYYWGTEQTHTEPLIQYQSALHRVDKQFADFLSLLREGKLLDHAIVVVLSDHGEAIELHGDRITAQKLYLPASSHVIPRFYPPTVETELVDQSAGHGTDVLGLVQYHTVLAFRLFGLATNQRQHVIGTASLLDIKPTLMGLLITNNKNNKNMSGYSLKQAITGHVKQLDNYHHLFIESDFSPQAVRSVHPEIKQVVFSGMDYFEIDPHTLRIHIKDSMEKMIIASKQYADYSGEWALALYPEQHHRMVPVLVNLRTRQWTCDLASHFATQSPALQMLVALQQFYGHEIGSVLMSP